VKGRDFDFELGSVLVAALVAVGVVAVEAADADAVGAAVLVVAADVAGIEEPDLPP
jgi:hypothetical protein